MSLPIFVAYHFACLVYVLHTCCICTMLNEGPLLSDVASCQTRRWSSVMFVHTHVGMLSLVECVRYVDMVAQSRCDVACSISCYVRSCSAYERMEVCVWQCTRV